MHESIHSSTDDNQSVRESGQSILLRTGWKEV
jgi:hypothetical protein